MADVLLEVGNKISMQLVKRGGLFHPQDDDTAFYSSEIIKIVSAKEIVIGVPIYQGHLVGISRKDIYLVRFQTQAGMYQCKCQVEQTGKDNNVMTASVFLISNLERYQRRAYFRFECRTNLHYTCVTSEQSKMFIDYKDAVTESRKRLLMEQIKAEELVSKIGMMLDISGGGMRFNAPDSFEPGEVVILKPDIEEITDSVGFLIGSVIASKSLGYDNITYENKVKFINISSNEREKIITYIFAAERKKISIN